MKRKWAFLALPILLAALIFGAKWRAEHPTPTKEDLEIRTLLLKSSLTSFEYVPRNTTSFHLQFGTSSKKDLKSLTEQFYSLPLSGRYTPISNDKVELVFVEGKLMVGIIIDVEKERGTVMLSSPKRGATFRNLHPATVKRWMELLLANPRVGPQLRARMK